MKKLALDLRELKRIKKQYYVYINQHNIDINYIYKISEQTHDINQIIQYYIDYIYNKFIEQIKLNNNKLFRDEQNKYNKEILELIKAEFSEYTYKKISTEIDKLPTIINNDNIMNFINELRNNNDKVGDITKPIPFDANDINNRDRPLLIYQAFDENNNIIEENVIIGKFGTHHNSCFEELKNKKYTNIKIACGYIYNDIIFLGNKEVNEFSNWSIVANIIKNILPQIIKIYHIPDEDNTKYMPLERISEKTTKLSSYLKVGIY